MNKKLQFLDCTLRDGGYYNDWSFSTPLINDYIYAASKAKVNIIEIGFRFLENTNFKGQCAYADDVFINSLEIPTNIDIAVMINAADLFISSDMEEQLSILFPLNKSDTKLSIVRIAAHYKHVEHLPKAIEWLNSKGYRVVVNLMQITVCTNDEINMLGKIMSSTDVEVLYFADSLGSMYPADVKNIINSLKKSWSGSIGIHTHDNIGLGLSNTLEAINCGATWVDSTVTGMGRGPGNAKTEELAIEIGNLTGITPDLMPLVDLIDNFFKELKAEHEWGTNPFYYLAGKNGIHPSFIQEMLKDKRFSTEDIFSTISYLKNNNGENYNSDFLKNSRFIYDGKKLGSWKPKDNINGKDTLILGTGPGVKLYKNEIESYIKKHSPIVLALNTVSDIDDELINYRVACHPIRLLSDSIKYKTFPQPIIMPLTSLNSDFQSELDDINILDFGLAISDEIEIFDTGCSIQFPMVLPYSLAICLSGGSENILLAGFDGYPNGDIRNEETSDIFNLYTSKYSKDLFTSITPTKHPIETKSIYKLLQSK